MNVRKQSRYTTPQTHKRWATIAPLLLHSLITDSPRRPQSKRTRRPMLLRGVLSTRFLFISARFLVNRFSFVVSLERACAAAATVITMPAVFPSTMRPSCWTVVASNNPKLGQGARETPTSRLLFSRGSRRTTQTKRRTFGGNKKTHSYRWLDREFVPKVGGTK